MFDDLDVTVQEDLTEFYNQTEIDDEDKQILFELYESGNFHAWFCPECEERCYYATPSSWDNFQGVNMNDYASYPCVSDEDFYLCNNCRSEPDLVCSERNYKALGGY